MRNGRHIEEKNRRGPWAWMVSKFGKVGAAVGVLLLIAGVALAVVLLRAEVTSSVDTAQAELAWQDVAASAPIGPGSHNGFYLLDDGSNGGVAGDGIPDDSATMPAGLTCSFTAETDGSLTVAISGPWLDGEMCGASANTDGLALVNTGTLTASSFAWDYNGNDVGAIGNGATSVEIGAARFTTAFQVQNLPASLAPAAFHRYSPYVLITLANGSAVQGDSISLTGMAVTADADRS